MNRIKYWNDDEVTLFAVEELRRLLRNAGEESVIVSSEIESNDAQTIHLITTTQYETIHHTEDSVSIKDDGFAIVRQSDVWIIGNEPRAILYGVYAFCRDSYGYQWVELKKETMTPSAIQYRENTYIHEPLFKRRGNVIETINDPNYIESLIDWGVKNGHNEFFFTFFLWEELRPYIYDTLKKRGVHITLGGHSLSYIIQQIQAEENNAELSQNEKLRFFAENESLQNKVIAKIVAICQRDLIVRRISLWPEDIGIDEKNADDFLPTYILFTEKLKDALEATNLNVDAEHIVYNAGLSWDMLEKKSVVASEKVDVLYAYWGRDYSKNIHAQIAEQKRALQALDDWNGAALNAGRELTVFEYYSDHFLLSELFPPLLQRIHEDIKDYKERNIHGILNLIVPLHKEQVHADIDAHYPWKWIHLMNNYLFARLAWGVDYEVAIEEYVSIYEKESEEFLHKLYQLEKQVAKHTKWNAPLFPARVVDPEKVENKQDEMNPYVYLKQLHEWLEQFDVSSIESLLPIQTADNSEAFTAKEMALIYMYYLKEVVYHNWKAWGSSYE